MANFYDCTLFFQSKDNEGWTETYCSENADPTEAVTQLTDLAPLRAALMPDWFSITQGRVSRIDVSGDAYPIVGAGFPFVGTFTEALSEPLEANTALKARFLGTPPHRNLKYIRGLTVSVV